MSEIEEAVYYVGEDVDCPRYRCFITSVDFFILRSGVTAGHSKHNIFFVQRPLLGIYAEKLLTHHNGRFRASLMRNSFRNL